MTPCPHCSGPIVVLDISEGNLELGCLHCGREVATLAQTPTPNTVAQVRRGEMRWLRRRKEFR
jgi:hypothetical protein